MYNRAAQEIIEAETSRTEDGEDAASRSAVARLFRASKGAMSVEEIREHVISLLIAGHETTSNTAGWCCYLLAANPDTQVTQLHADRSNSIWLCLCTININGSLCAGGGASEAVRALARARRAPYVGGCHTVILNPLR